MSATSVWFGLCISIMQLFDCILAIQTFFWCPTNVDGIQNTTKNHLLCNDFVCFLFVCAVLSLSFNFSLIRCKRSHLLWILGLLSILQLKINELLDYRICGQSSSNPIVRRNRLKFYTFAMHNSHSSHSVFLVSLFLCFLFAFCGMWLPYWIFVFGSHGICSIAVHQTYGIATHTIRLTR